MIVNKFDIPLERVINEVVYHVLDPDREYGLVLIHGHRMAHEVAIRVVRRIRKLSGSDSPISSAYRSHTIRPKPLLVELYPIEPSADGISARDLRASSRLLVAYTSGDLPPSYDCMGNYEVDLELIL